MKAEERHKLKSNELAESLEQVPAYLRAHGSKLLAGTVVVLVVVIGGLWWWNSQAAAQEQRAADLHELLIDGDRLQVMAAFQARQSMSGGPEAAWAGSVGYSSAEMVARLEELAGEAVGTNLGGTAMLQQAEVLRSELMYATREINASEKEAICQRAEKLYSQVVAGYGDSVILSGAAQMGRGLIAEERAQWDKAREIYGKLAAESGTAMGGTIYPDQARERLILLESLVAPVVFKAASATMLPAAVVEMGGADTSLVAPAAPGQEQ